MVEFEIGVKNGMGGEGRECIEDLCFPVRRPKIGSVVESGTSVKK